VKTGHHFCVVNSGSFARFRLINCLSIQINCFVFDILRFNSKPNSGTTKIMHIVLEVVTADIKIRNCRLALFRVFRMDSLV